MHYTSSGKYSLTGFVSTLPFLLSTAGRQWKKYVMVVRLLFPYLHNIPLRARRVASLSVRPRSGLVWNIPVMLLGIPIMFGGNVLAAMLVTLEIILSRYHSTGSCFLRTQSVMQVFREGLRHTAAKVGKKNNNKDWVLCSQTCCCAQQ